MSRYVLFLLVTFLNANPLDGQVADVSFTIDHCVAASHILGAIRLDIDTAKSPGPFSVRLQGPGGMTDTIASLSSHSYTYRNLLPGTYCLTIQCCAVCTAYSCMEVEDYTRYLIGEVPVYLSRAKTVPQNDSSAILLACTNVSEENGAWCEATFTLYGPAHCTDATLQTMLAKAITAIQRKRAGLLLDESGEKEDSDPDAWIDPPFEALVRIAADGTVGWVYLDGF